MSKRDYTSSASRSRRRTSPRKAKVNVKKSKILFFLAVGLVLALGASLYWLTEQKAAPSSRRVRQRPSIRALPSKPQERWRYIKALENKKIIVNQPMSTPAPSPKKPPLAAVGDVTAQRLPDQQHLRNGKALQAHIAPPRWELRCGAFHNTEKAQALRATLALLGIESSVIQDNGWQRVIVGPYHNRTPVDDTLKRLKRADLHHCIIAHPPD